VKLVEQWREIEAGLAEGWDDARLDVVPETRSELPRAAALLGPANPGRVGDALRLEVRRGGGPAGPEGIRRLLGRVDDARIWSELRLVDAGAEVADERPPESSLAADWDAAAATLPPDWSDVYAELTLRSSDYVPRAALLGAPLNPTRADRLSLRFRAARQAGYGTSPEMVRRCLQRLDAEEIRGDLRILRVLSESRHVATQGPVWRVGGRSV
jgi:hypothetical protein